MARHDRAILDEIKSLEPLPQVALRVLELSAREEVVPRDLITVIETDAAMTAKVLKLSNSAYYGFRREIGSLAEAGNLLGVSPLVNLVLTSCAGRYFKGQRHVDPRVMRALWETSVSNALSASLLARISGGVDKNRAYTAGLLQNIGQVVLEPHFRRAASELEAEVARGTPWIEAERAVLGIDHAEVGARLCERWSFPAVLVDAVRWHHAPENSREDPLLTCFVHLGEQLTTGHARGARAGGRSYALADSALDRAGFDRAALVGLEEVLAREVSQAREFVEAV